MFPTRTLLKLLAVLEEDLGVNHFAVGAFHLWPAMRFLLAPKLQDNDQTAPRPPHAAEAEAIIARKFDAVMAARGPAVDIPPAQLFGLQPRTHAKRGNGLLLISRAEDHNQKTDLGYYAPVMDPWAELAKGRWPSTKAEIAGGKFNETQPRRIQTLAAVSAVASHYSQTDLAQRDAILKASRILSSLVSKWLETELKINLPSLSADFERELAAQWHDKQVYRELIEATQPGLVITSCYYFRPTLGAVWAARELGVPVADAQHGGNGEYHIGYTHWRNVPESGYQLLPDYFLVWDNISANNILRWLPAGATSPQALITGRFGLTHAGHASLPEGQASPITTLTQGSEKTILVTLQTLGSTGLSPIIVDAMRAGPPTWTWLVRGHPMAQAWGKKELMPEALEATMKAAGVARYDARLSTSLPLASLLPHINHHLTGFSGTVQECAAYGVRTTFTHSTVWSFFGNYIEMGVADFAKTPEDVVQSIAAAKPFPNLSDMLVMPRDDETAISILSQILSA